jgi:uncharacterized phage-like protein YoqJ
MGKEQKALSGYRLNMSKLNRCIISGVDVSLLPFEFNEDGVECQRVKAKLLNAITYLMSEGVDEFYTDCRFGFPLWGGEIVTGLMRYNDIKLYIVFPHEDVPHKYAENWRHRFFEVHRLSTDVISTYIDYDIDGNMAFWQESDEELLQRAADYMLNDCGRLLFCGDIREAYADSPERYLYGEAIEKELKITTLDLGGK